MELSSTRLYHTYGGLPENLCLFTQRRAPLPLLKIFTRHWHAFEIAIFRGSYGLMLFALTKMIRKSEVAKFS
jgi:hypothetical protein